MPPVSYCLSKTIPGYATDSYYQYVGFKIGHKSKPLCERSLCGSVGEEGADRDSPFSSLERLGRLSGSGGWLVTPDSTCADGMSRFSALPPDQWFSLSRHSVLQTTAMSTQSDGEGKQCMSSSSHSGFNCFAMQLSPIFIVCYCVAQLCNSWLVTSRVGYQYSTPVHSDEVPSYSIECER